MRTNAKNKKKVLVLHGPNLNMLGRREPSVYGSATLEDINLALKNVAAELSIEVETFQSNSEGALVSAIQESLGKYDGMIINPAAYTHTSVAMRDALLLVEVPIIEVHLSNIYKREPFRHKSFMADVVSAQITGLGPRGYLMALRALSEMMMER